MMILHNVNTVECIMLYKLTHASDAVYAVVCYLVPKLAAAEIQCEQGSIGNA